jgi:hypothetical protein
MASGSLRGGWATALAGLVLAAAVPAYSWQELPRPRPLRRTVLQGRAVTPNGTADGLLELYPAGAKGGLGRLVFTLYQADAPAFLDSLKSFHFDEFEGPGAPAAVRRLTQVEVRGKAGEVRVRVRQNGYHSAEVKGGFTFDTGVGGARARLELQKISRALRSGGTALVVRVTDTKDPRIWIQGEFPTAGRAWGLDRHLVGRPAPAPPGPGLKPLSGPGRP